MKDFCCKLRQRAWRRRVKKLWVKNVGKIDFFLFFTEYVGLQTESNEGDPATYDNETIDEFGDISWNKYRKNFKVIDPENRGNRLEETYRALRRDCHNFGKIGKCRKKKRKNPDARFGEIRSFNAWDNQQVCPDQAALDAGRDLILTPTLSAWPQCARKALNRFREKPFIWISYMIFFTTLSFILPSIFETEIHEKTFDIKTTSFLYQY